MLTAMIITFLSMTCLKSTQPRGKGLWKFNNSLLENKDFCSMIKKGINLIKSTYALPMYSPNYVEVNDGSALELSIPVTLFLETLLCQLRGQTIKFLKNLKKKETESERKLIKDIETLKKVELENLRYKKIKGCIVRSRANLVDNWEKSSKFFLNLEKRNFLNKNIPSLKDGKNNTISDSKTIMNMQKDFYQSLFSSTPTTQVEHTKYHKYLHNITKISNHTKLMKDSDIEIEELEYAIKLSKQNKAPGPDGFSNEFFKFFVEELKHWIPRYFREAIENDFFSEIALEGIITCIPKQGKLRNDLKNWRPLTLLNSIYKCYSSIIANRLKTTLPSLINEDQTGFISGRFIGENTRMIYDTIDYCETFQEGILIILDFSKAFDTIEWPFIDYTLNLLNFGDKFINYIKLCQRNSKSRVEQNGHLSSYIPLSRG